MKKTILISLVIKCIFFVSCTELSKNADTNIEVSKQIRISENIGVELNQNKNHTEVYTTYQKQKHGILYQFDKQNRLESANIYYLDTLMQSKEYHWNKQKLDSVCFFSYDYSKKNVIQKEFYLNFPEDSLFFEMKFNPFNLKTAEYTFELIGSGYITAIPNSDTIYAENYFSNFARMAKAEKYIYVENSFEEDPKRPIKKTQAFVLSIKHKNGEAYLKRQLRVVHVPLFVEDSMLYNKLINLKVAF